MISKYEGLKKWEQVALALALHGPCTTRQVAKAVYGEDTRQARLLVAALLSMGVTKGRFVVRGVTLARPGNNGGGVPIAQKYDLP